MLRNLRGKKSDFSVYVLGMGLKVWGSFNRNKHCLLVLIF